jgi:hypothetical protein
MRRDAEDSENRKESKSKTMTYLWFEDSSFIQASSLSDTSPATRICCLSYIQPCTRTHLGINALKIVSIFLQDRLESNLNGITATA